MTATARYFELVSLALGETDDLALAVEAAGLALEAEEWADAYFGYIKLPDGSVGWAGSNPPGDGSGWVQTAPGPRGGKYWKRAAGYKRSLPGQAKQVGTERRPDPTAVAADVRALATSGRAVSEDDVRALSGRLLAMSVKEIQQFKKDFGLSASGPKAQLALKVAADALGVAREKLGVGKTTTRAAAPKPQKQPKTPREAKKKVARTPKASQATTPGNVDAARLSIGKLDDVRQVIRKAAVDAGEYQQKGGAPEKMKGIEVDGVRYRWGETNEHAAAKTLYMMHQGGIKQPDRLLRMLKEVTFTSQRNVDDDYWTQQYGRPIFSEATGGDGKITAYDGGWLTAGTIAHELGHILAQEEFGDYTPPPGSAYHRAQQEESPVSEYGEVHPSEDFAEAVKQFVTVPERLKKSSPKKYMALEAMIR